MQSPQKIFIPLLTIITLALYSCGSSSPSLGMQNMVATMEVKEPIEGVCNNLQVISILPFEGNGQEKAVAPVTEEEMERQLNQIDFLKTADKDYEDEGIVNILVNCKGEVVQCYVGNKTKHAELDQQIEAVFKQWAQWQAGNLRGKKVDTMNLFSFTIKDGKITL